MAIHVTIWNEIISDEHLDIVIMSIPEEHRGQARGHFLQAVEKVAVIHPEGIHGTLRRQLSSENDFVIRTATLDQPEHGLTADVLDQTDVLIWWGHLAHDLVSDEIVDRIQRQIGRAHV